MKSHDPSSNTSGKHNELSESIIEFKPYEIDKQSDVSIDMHRLNFSRSTLPFPSCSIDWFSDNFLLILLVVLLISYSNKKRP